MRLMMRWSPMRSVSSMEPEGMTRACPMVALMSKKASPTQNHAMTSRCTRWPRGSFGSSTFLAGALAVPLAVSLPIGSCVVSAFTFHRHGSLDGQIVGAIAILWMFGRVAVALADFELHEVRGIDAGITRRTKLAFGVIHGLAKRGKRNVAERIGPEEFANVFRGV